MPPRPPSEGHRKTHFLFVKTTLSVNDGFKRLPVNRGHSLLDVPAFLWSDRRHVFCPGRACFLFMATCWATRTLDLPWSSAFCPPWRPWGRSELQNATKTHGFSMISRSPKGSPETLRGPPIAPAKHPQAPQAPAMERQGGPKRAPRVPRDPKGPPKETPRMPKQPHGTPRTSQGTSKKRQGTSKDPQGPPRDLKDRPRGPL